MVATLIAGERRLNGDAVLARAMRGVGGLEALGVREGEVVAAMLRNDIAFLETMLIARTAGCYFCPINWHFKADEAGHILRDSGAAVLIVHADLLPQIEGAVPASVPVIAVEPSAQLQAAFRLDAGQCRAPPGVPEWESWLADAPVHARPARQPRGSLNYSSGTTGRPKGIKRAPLGPEDVARLAESARIAFGIEPGVRTVLVAPLYHSAPASYGLFSLLMGELAVIRPRLDAEQLLVDIERHRASHLYLVPTHFVRLLRLPEEVKRRHDLSSVKFVACTGSPCPPDVKRAMIEWWGPVIHEGYASSEAGFITMCTSQEALARPGTVGRVLPSAEARILDDDGRELPPFQPGTIYCRNGNYTEFTYVNNAAARRAIERDGLITVGDVGYFDADGYLYICDRKADMVISGGVNIYPAEIEAALVTLAGVADCAVFGIPDAEFGEALAAHVQLQPAVSIDREAIRAHLRARLADYKVPRVIEFADELPREESGKIFKRKLREPYWREAGRRI
jgi:long-chain acyl-CoA synthetase